MELKDIPRDVVRFLSQWLETSDLLSLISTSTEMRTIFDYQPCWLQRAKQYGIYQSDFDRMAPSVIKERLVAHMKSLYAQVLTVCPNHHAKLLTTIVLEDDAAQLQQRIVQTAKASVTALMPVVMQFGRIRIMHSLFVHFNVSGSYHWLLHAIRHEHYAAIKYLVEVRQVPLVTDEPFALLPCVNRLWDESYIRLDKLGRSYCATFSHYNNLLLREIIRCRHPKIVRYLKTLINELLETMEIDHFDYNLLTHMNRHSVERIDLEFDCPSPALSQLRL